MCMKLEHIAYSSMYHFPTIFLYCQRLNSNRICKFIWYRWYEMWTELIGKSSTDRSDFSVSIRAFEEIKCSLQSLEMKNNACWVLYITAKRFEPYTSVDRFNYSMCVQQQNEQTNVKKANERKIMNSNESNSVIKTKSVTKIK